MPSAALGSRLPGLAAEGGKFGVIGAVNLLLDIAIFNALLFSVLPHGAVLAKAVSTIVSATSSYFMNRHWTWRHRERSGTRRELLIFLVLSAIALGITELCLFTSHDVLGYTSKLADNVAANVVGLALSTVWRFWSFRRWVFRESLIPV